MKKYTYSNHTNVSAQYVTLCLLEHILLYLYVALLTMIHLQDPKESSSPTAQIRKSVRGDMQCVFKYGQPIG
jgi:hypothetical protein